VGKLNALFELVFDRSLIVFVDSITDDAGALPFANKKGKRSELEWEPLRKNEQLFLTLEQLVKNEH
jgi:hypothetical protein